MPAFGLKKVEGKEVKAVKQGFAGSIPMEKRKRVTAQLRKAWFGELLDQPAKTGSGER